MWQYVESTTYPEIIDKTSSAKWFYVRRNITKKQDEVSKEVYYSYEELKIPKEVYDIFVNEQDNCDRLNDVEDVLAEILGGDLQ